jgi:hypothetical protein
LAERHDFLVCRQSSFLPACTGSTHARCNATTAGGSQGPRELCPGAIVEIRLLLSRAIFIRIFVK